MSATIITAVDAINAEIATHEVAIERLVKAREALGALITADDTAGIILDEHVPAPRRRGTRITADDVVIGVGEPEVQEPVKATVAKGKQDTKSRSRSRSTKKDRDLKAERVANLEKARAAKAAKNGNKPSRRDEIVALLTKKGKPMTPREIGDKLGIAPNYVYHIKRELANS